MKLSLKHQAHHKIYNEACSVTEYKFDDDKMDFSIAIISGRYPEQNRVMNEISNELAYVTEGEGKIVINHQEQPLSAGDVIIIEAGEKYYWEGNMKLFVTCNPTWKPEQRKIVE